MTILNLSDKQKENIGKLIDQGYTFNEKASKEKNAIVMSKRNKKWLFRPKNNWE